MERDDAIHPAHLAALRRATPAERLAAVAALYPAGIQLRVAGLRMTRPVAYSNPTGLHLRPPVQTCLAAVDGAAGNREDGLTIDATTLAARVGELARRHRGPCPDDA